MNIEEINKMSYTDFIGYINQWNVLPGAYVTLSKWKVFGNVTNKSNILELACTSGFSLREMSIITGCSGLGIDISEKSIEAAKKNKSLFAESSNIDYATIDVNMYAPSKKYSHVIAGAALQFFSNPKEIISNIVNKYLMDGGYLLVSPFYTTKEIPKKLVNKAKKVFGIKITTFGYKEAMSLYKGFEIIYEDRCDIIQESSEELEHYCNSTIKRACDSYNISDQNVYKTMYDRLMEIKLMSNELRPYQKYTVLVLRYRNKVYPNRYTEIF